MGKPTQDDSAPQGIGLECARCGCYQSWVVKTVRLAVNRIRRYRVCDHCGHRFTSVEIHVRELPKSPPSY